MQMKYILVFLFGFLFTVNTVTGQHSISGFVVSIDSAEALPGVTIQLKDRYGLFLKNPLSTKSDSSGFYYISGISEGHYTLHAWNAYDDEDDTYAVVIQSRILMIDEDLTADIAFSERAFRNRLESRKNDDPSKLFSGAPVRSASSVADQVLDPQIFLNSRRDTVFAWFFQKIDLSQKRIIQR